MSERVEKFIDDFEKAIENRVELIDRRPRIQSTTRQAARLADLLDELRSSGLTTGSVSSHDIHALIKELSSGSDSVEWRQLLDNARALVTVMEDGIVEGDIDTLRSVLTRAESLPQGVARKGRRGDPNLPKPIRVSCTSCDAVIAGRREGSRNWNGITKRIRDHERSDHEGYSSETRNALRPALQLLPSGKGSVEAARYILSEI